MSVDKVDNNVFILSKQPVPVPRLAIAAIVILAAGVIAMLVYMRSKPSSSQEAVPGQELVIGVDRVTLYVPKDVATLTGVISISSLEANLHPVAGEEKEWFRSQVVDVQYLDGQGVPYGNVNFSGPVLICFMIKELWLDYTQHPDEYQVQYYDEKQNPPGWVTLPMSANADRYQLCGQTDHLSIFALAVKPQEEIPVTSGTLTATPTASLSPTPTTTPNPRSTPTPSDNDAPLLPTQAAIAATRRVATNVPPTVVPPTNIPPTDVPPTVVPPTNIPPTAAQPTDPPIDPPTEPPTEPPTDPTEPPIIELPTLGLPLIN